MPNRLIQVMMIEGHGGKLGQSLTHSVCEASKLALSRAAYRRRQSRQQEYVVDSLPLPSGDHWPVSSVDRGRRIDSGKCVGFEIANRTIKSSRRQRHLESHFQFHFDCLSPL